MNWGGKESQVVRKFIHPCTKGEDEEPMSVEQDEISPSTATEQPQGCILFIIYEFLMIKE